MIDEMVALFPQEQTDDSKKIHHADSVDEMEDQGTLLANDIKSFRRPL